MDSTRSRVSVRDVVDSYHKMKVAIESDVLAFKVQHESDQREEAPGKENLNTELRWLIEDSVRSAAGQWQSLFAEKKQKQKERGEEVISEGGSEDDNVLDSRLSVAELEMVWRYRLEKRVPIQYILGTVSWYDFELSVGPGVLIPRPETEVLLDYALKALKEDRDMERDDGKSINQKQRPQRWLDLGTGSGALAVGLALHATEHDSINIGSHNGVEPPIQVVAVEASPGAAKYTRENIRRHKLGEVVHVVEGSWFQPLHQIDQDGKKLATTTETAQQQQQTQLFDGIVSNPPYIREEEMLGLQAEVRLHEPHKALFCEENGLGDLIHIVEEAPRYLVPGGFLGLETGGPAQAHKLKELLLSNASKVGGGGGVEMTEVEVKADLQGVERFLTARRKR